MGGAPSTGFSYQTNIPKRYDKDLIVTYEVVSSLVALKIGEEFNLSIVAPIAQLQQQFPEFEFTQVRYDLYKARRFVYLGPSERCCITNENFFIEQGFIITCPPALKTPSTNRSCDLTLSNYCFQTTATPSTNSDSTHICKNWFEGYIADRGYDIFTNQGYQYCQTPQQREANKFCNVYLDVMRRNPDSSLHDKFLDRIRDGSFRCSYPLQQTLERAKRTNLPRVCWDPQCIASSLWKLKFIDYVTRLNCPVNLSYINFSIENSNTLRYITVDNTETETLQFKSIKPEENVYTQPLKDVGKIFFDSFSIVTMIFLTIIIFI